MESEFQNLLVKYESDPHFYDSLQRIISTCQHKINLRDSERENIAFQIFLKSSISRNSNSNDEKEELLALCSDIHWNGDDYERADYHVCFSCGGKIGDTTFSKWYTGDNEGEGTTGVHIGSFLTVDNDGENQVDINKAYIFHQSFNFQHVTIYSLLDMLVSILSYKNYYECDVGAHTLYSKEIRTRKMEQILPLQQSHPSLWAKYLPRGVRSLCCDISDFDTTQPLEKQHDLTITYLYKSGSGQSQILQRSSEADGSDAIISVREKRKSNTVVTIADDTERAFFDALFLDIDLTVGGEAHWR